MNAKRVDARIKDNPGFARLTPRERDCLRALRENGEAKLAARSLSIGLATFNEHLAKARRKLGVSRSWEAARLLGEWEAQGRPSASHARTPEPSAPGSDGAGSDSALDQLIARLGPWAGPLLVALTAAALALAAVTLWATAELALRFQDLK